MRVEIPPLPPADALDDPVAYAILCYDPAQSEASKDPLLKSVLGVDRVEGHARPAPGMDCGDVRLDVLQCVEVRLPKRRPTKAAAAAPSKDAVLVEFDHPEINHVLEFNGKSSEREKNTARISPSDAQEKSTLTVAIVVFDGLNGLGNVLCDAAVAMSANRAKRLRSRLKAVERPEKPSPTSPRKAAKGGESSAAGNMRPRESRVFGLIPEGDEFRRAWLWKRSLAELLKPVTKDDRPLRRLQTIRAPEFRLLVPRSTPRDRRRRNDHRGHFRLLTFAEPSDGSRTKKNKKKPTTTSTRLEGHVDALTCEVALGNQNKAIEDALKPPPHEIQVAFYYMYHGRQLCKTELTDRFMCPFCACNMRGIRELETHMHATHAHFNYVVASRGSKVVAGKKCGLNYIRKSKMDEYVMQVRCEDAHLKYARLGEGGAGSRLIEDEDDGSETEWFFAHGGWYVGAGTYRIVRKSGAFYTLVPIRPQWRGERRSLRTFPGASLRPPHAFNPRLRRL